MCGAASPALTGLLNWDEYGEIYRGNAFSVVALMGESSHPLNGFWLMGVSSNSPLAAEAAAAAELLSFPDDDDPPRWPAQLL